MNRRSQRKPGRTATGRRAKVLLDSRGAALSGLRWSSAGALFRLHSRQPGSQTARAIARAADRAAVRPLGLQLGAVVQRLNSSLATATELEIAPERSGSSNRDCHRRHRRGRDVLPRSRNWGGIGLSQLQRRYGGEAVGLKGHQARQISTPVRFSPTALTRAPKTYARRVAEPNRHALQSHLENADRDPCYSSMCTRLFVAHHL